MLNEVLKLTKGEVKTKSKKTLDKTKKTLYYSFI